MICSFVLGLYPEESNSEIIYKYENYDSLKGLLLQELTVEEMKKITVSNFLTKDKAFKDKNYYLKISSIDSQSTLKLLKLLFLYKIINQKISIQGIKFRITNIYHNSIWSKQLDINKFMENEPQNKVTIKLLTPTIFKVGNQYINSLEPVYIFKNLIKKIRNSSISGNEFLKSINKIDINKIKVEESEVKRKNIKKLNEEGIVGTVTFSIDSTIREEILLFNLLLYFAFFSGIGYMTEKGYGQNTSSLNNL